MAEMVVAEMLNEFLAPLFPMEGLSHVPVAALLRGTGLRCQ